VAQEKHQDGTNHLHAFLRYESRVLWSPTRWNIGGYHGNYQSAKSWQNVLAYCKKGGNFISSFDPDAAASKKAARNAQLLEEDPKKLIAEGSIGVLQLPQLLKAKEQHRLLKPPTETNGPRGVWITGLSGAGKSHFVRTRHPADELYLKSPKNKWFCGYKAEPYILIDDFDHSCVSLSCDLKLWADKWACTAESKGGKVSLCHTTLYVTSQYTIDQLWPGDENEELRIALIRRFHFVRVQRDCGWTELFIAGRDEPLDEEPAS